MRRPPALVAATVLAAGLLAVLPASSIGPAGTAFAIDHDRGHPGFCRDDRGVTVVVDFQELGGTTIVRCNPQGNRGTGLDALKGAGFEIDGVQRWGEAFICRIENRPSAAESIPVRDNEGYQERCIDTPPAAAYWSYWHAANNCSWDYSQWGVKNRDFIAGGFEAWSFSLNATADTNPRPRIAPVRPGTEGQPCRRVQEPAPTTDDPFERQQAPGGSGGQTETGPGSGSGSGADSADSGGASIAESGGSATADGLPAPLPREQTEAPDPADNVEFTGGDELADVATLRAEQSNASPYARWAAVGAIALLGVAMGLTAWRRKRAREA